MSGNADGAGPDWVGKAVRIRKEQSEWIDKNSINFSELVRRLLDEEMARREGKANGPEVPA